MIGSKGWPMFALLLVSGMVFQTLPLQTIGASGSLRLNEDEYRMRMNVTEAPVAFHCDSEGSLFGASITGNGDVNGDGLCDLLIGSPANSQNGSSSGRVDLFLGGDDEYKGDMNSSSSDVTFLGMAATDEAGSSIGIVGDLNGDGKDDIVICDRHSYHSSCRGSAKVFLGRAAWPRNMNLNDCDLLLETDSSCPNAYLKVSKCGDVNNDGFDDIFLSNAYANLDGHFYAGKVYFFYGGKDLWQQNRSLESADCSMKGKNTYDYFGLSISELGDMNRDGFDDIIIGASGVNLGNPDCGRAYIFFGRTNGFGKNVSCDSANVFLNGEKTDSGAGWAVSGGEDMNGDGLHDIVIGAPYHSERSGSYPCGKIFIVFGRTGPWPISIDLADADASYLGEMERDYLGSNLDLIGDIDGDGLSELLVSSPYSLYGGYYLGHAYLVKGRNSGWEKDQNISKVSFASFIGEAAYDYCGTVVAGIGDIDIDGSADICISSPYNDHSAPNGGSVYIFPGLVGFPPKQVISIDLFLDEGMEVPGNVVDRGEMVYIRLIGVDSNSSTVNSAIVNISLNNSHPVPLGVVLRETGKSTGIYTGKFMVPLIAVWNEMMTVTSTADTSKSDIIKIDTPVRVQPRLATIALDEGDDLVITFHNAGWSEECAWDFQTDSEWMEWSAKEHRITGTPSNEEVGQWSATITLSDGKGHNDSLSMDVKVKNVPPRIITDDVPIATEDILYLVDYCCDEDEEGPMTWSLASNATFLEMISDAGILRGMPTNDDVGTYWARVIVDDGKGGEDVHPFNLTVVNVNDPPVIVTEDRTKVDQGMVYRNVYEADDEDRGDVLTWSLETEADWLSMNGSTLFGTPGCDDIGKTMVTVSVTDRAGETDRSSFELEVVNVNDGPVWKDLPGDLSVLNGRVLRFDVNATDADPMDEIVYSLTTTPYTDMSIDKSSGTISWAASTGFFERPPYILTAKLSATDGKVTITHSFKVTVTLSRPPVSQLVSPSDGSRVPFKGSILRWSASDPDHDDLTFGIYIGENKALVSILDESTLFIDDLDSTEMGTQGLEQGKTYYWTVIPSDGSSRGSCSNKVRSFILNSPPSFNEMEAMTVKQGKEISFILKANDNDPQDRTNFRFSLKEGPSGMSVDEISGRVRWTPSEDQTMLHRAVFVVNDSVETSETVLTIEVLPSNEGSGKDIIILVCIGSGIVLLLIAIVFGTVLIIRKNRGKDDDSANNVDVPSNSRTKEQETSQRSLCSVALDASEAHRNDQLSKAPKTYEELYGTSPPKEEESLNTRELRDYIKGSIEELERISDREE